MYTGSVSSASAASVAPTTSASHVPAPASSSMPSAAASVTFPVEKKITLNMYKQSSFNPTSVFTIILFPVMNVMHVNGNSMVSISMTLFDLRQVTPNH